MNFMDNVYLYGHHKITTDDNKNILLASIRFINESGCFL